MAQTPATRSKPANSGPQRGDTTVRVAVVLLAVVATGAALIWLAPILTPLALAIFLLIMIDSFMRFLKRRLPFLHDWAALCLALVVAGGLFLATAWIVVIYAAGFGGQIESYLPRINQIVAQVSGVVGLGDPPTLEQMFDQLDPREYLGTATQGLQNVASVTVVVIVVLVYLGFLIASRAGFDRKTVRLFPERDERRRAMEVFERARQGVEKYLWVQTITGLMIAAASWGVMAIIGLDNAFFWAFLIFVAGYVPIVGPAIGGLLPPVFALVQFDSYLQPLVLLAALNAINMLVSNIILPRMQGDSLNLDPVAVLLSLAFWGALWGVPGMFLAPPLTVLAMVILAQFDGSRWMAVMISANGDPLGSDKEQSNQDDDKKKPRASKKID